jgi:hypothetical protein
MNTPLPKADQLTLVCIESEAFNSIESPSQMKLGADAKISGLDCNVITMLSLDGTQDVVAVRVIVTLPFIISCGPGVYVAFITVSDGENVPFPEVDHCTAPELVINIPPRGMFAEPMQSAVSIPVCTRTASVKDTSMESTDALHCPLFVEVSINHTNPCAVSAGLKMYVALRSVFEGIKTPKPDVLHTPVVDPPETEPDNCTEAVLSQTNKSGPALTSGASLKINTSVSTTEEQ